MHWKEILRRNFTLFDPLARFLQLTPESKKLCWKDPSFRINVPERLALKMEKGNVDDPLFLQFVSLRKEKEEKEGFIKDPVGENAVCRQEKLLQKYPGRALLLLTSACAMHCRYCFRQNFPYETKRKGVLPELEAIANDPTIEEVILSGGDPLSLEDRVLEGVIDALNAIPHVSLIRFHTRFPIGIPERIDSGLLAVLERCKKQLVFVLHSNHPKELGDDLFERISLIQKLGIPLLNQTVLLRGINDDVGTLSSLFLQLVKRGVMPYYLHQLDRVLGAGHFEVEEAQGKELIDSLRKKLPGYAVPRYVREVAGELSKVDL